MRETLLAVDGNSLMHRAFHALPLMDVNGVYTNAVHGFLSMLLKAVQDLSPRYIAVAFDLPVPTFRHTAYADYKAGRRAMPEEMRPQFPIIKEILAAMRLGVLTAEGYEADDILGTLSVKCRDHISSPEIRNSGTKDIVGLLMLAAGLSHQSDDFLGRLLWQSLPQTGHQSCYQWGGKGGTHVSDNATTTRDQGGW